MRYQPGQTVLLLDTEFKPATTAVVKESNTETLKYLIEFRYSENSLPEQIWVPQERLSTATDIVLKKGN
jgi:hypothetical protein